MGMGGGGNTAVITPIIGTITAVFLWEWG